MESVAVVRATKLKPPTYSFNFVKTAALKLLTGKVPLPKVVTVVAPPGYGKTILLAQIFQHLTGLEAQCLWIGLDDRDADVGRLLGLLETALEVGQKELSWPFDYDANVSTTGRISQIVANLTARTEPVTIFFDNIDFCVSGDVAAVLNALVFDTPDRATVVISSSSGMPFNTLRALLELRLQAIGPAELSFNADDIGYLFEEAGITRLSSSKLAAIQAQSEGWPAAVRLMQVIMATDPGVDGYGGLPLHNQVQLADVLSRRLLSRFEPALVEFLCQIAEFKQFTVDMVAVATRNERAREFIHFLVTNNVLIIPLDEHQRWFRFHTLFRQFLISLAQERLEPGAREQMLGRGAVWLEEQGIPLQALDLAVSCGDQSMSARLLERLAWDLVRNQGDLPSFMFWVQKARAIGAVLGPEASFWYVWALIFNREYEAAKKALAELEALIERSSVSCPAMLGMSAKAELAEIVLKVHMDQMLPLQQAGELWLERYEDGDSFEVAAVAGAMALALLADHQFAAARRAVRQSKAAIAGTNSLYGRAWVTNVSAMIDIGSGNLGDADEALEELQPRLEAELGQGAVVGAVTALVRARGLFAQGRQAEAKGLVETYLSRTNASGILDFTWMGIEVILPYALRGESAITLAELRRLVADHPRRLGLLFELTTIRILVNQCRVEEAAQRAVDMGIWSYSGGFRFPDDAELTSERSMANITGIALLTAYGHFKKAEELIQAELQQAADAGRRYAEVELFLAQVGIFVKASRWREALRAFAKAISAAAERRLLQPFLERGSLVSHLMANCKLKELGIATMAENALVTDICRSLGCERPTTMLTESEEAFDSGGALETLTARELELLSMLEKGFDNQRIAETLSVTVRTVKWHLSNLYGKLDVKNRTGALAKARNLGLL